MKKIIVILLSIIFCNINGQTLTQTFNEPKVGDVDKVWDIDTSAYFAGLPITTTGSNVVWNFTSLVTGSVSLLTYLTPTAVPSATAYTGCSMVLEDNGSYTFLKSVTSPSAQTELLGLDIGFGSVKLTNSAIAAKYPVSYGYNETDQVSGSFSSTITNGTCSGNMVTVADGSGTLNLPSGVSLTNVLRLKSVLNITLTAFFIPVATAKRTVYSYYHSTKKFPILNITYTEVGATASTPSVTGVVTGNYFVLIGEAENERLTNKSVNFYPNPVQNSLNFTNVNQLKSGEIKIYNQLWELVLNKPFENQVDISELESGIYYYQIQSNGFSNTKRFIKE